ncbi:extracellular calcium-sensing receptor-like isoform X1 [Dendropsophus ebraccatus]|uniref:extracellular calcium-sensing receptor-like isoform X1 n=1 Tax=Dendropsophus ebraccatus TaxID=150705 RepID=UPI0038318EBE
MISRYTYIQILLLLSQCIHALYTETSQCSLGNTELEGIEQAGDILIGIMLTFHLDVVYHHNTFTERPPWTPCTKFNLDHYQRLQAAIFAIEEINSDPEFLPNITLGFQAYDACIFVQHSLTGTLQVITGQRKAVPNYRCLVDRPLSSVIGHTSSTYSILMAHILGLLRYPQISHLSTSPLLSDRRKFPSFFRTIPSDVFQSKVKPCTGAEDLRNVTNSYNDDDHLRITYNVYTAVKIIAMALKNLRSCKSDENSCLIQTCADKSKLEHWKLLRYIKRARLTLSSGRELFFDSNGDPPAVYDIVNWQLGPDDTIKHVKVGSYDTTRSLDQVFHINTSIIHWPVEVQMVPRSVCSESCSPGYRKATRRGEPVCCFQCVPCPQGEISNQTDALDCIKCPWDQWPNLQKSKCLPKTIEFLSYEDPLGSTLVVTTVISSLVPASILRLFIKYKNTPIVKANNYHLSCFLLFSLSLCFLCSLAFIGPPQAEKCLLRQCAFGIVFALCVSCILAKTITVVFAFWATKPGSRLRKWTSLRVSLLFIFICSLLQFLLCIIWVSLAPPFPQYISTQAQPTIISYECNEGSPIAFWCMLGYLGLLASISFIVAFMARRLPDSFNEAKFITFSMLAFLTVWVSFIPAYLSAQGKYTVAMEIFAILCSSWALVICMFLPKCFIILFRPNMNSRENLVRKVRV